MHSVFIEYIYVYSYQAIPKFYKSKRGKYGKYLWRHFYRGGGGGGVWKGYICGDVINRQPLICFTD